MLPKCTEYSILKTNYWFKHLVFTFSSKLVRSIVQEWDDQHEHTYSNYVRTQDVTLKTCRRRWMIGRNGERGSRISALAARHDDDDDDAACLALIHIIKCTKVAAKVRPIVDLHMPFEFIKIFLECSSN